MLPFIFMTSSGITNPLESTFRVPHSDRRWYWVQVESAGYLFFSPQRTRADFLYHRSVGIEALFSAFNGVGTSVLLFVTLFAHRFFWCLASQVPFLRLTSIRISGYLTTCLEWGVRRFSLDQSICSPSRQPWNLIDIPKYFLLMSLEN